MLHDKYTELLKDDAGLNFPKFCNFLSDKKLKFDITDWVDNAITGIKDEDLVKASLSPDHIEEDVTEKDYIMFLQKKMGKKGDCPKDKKKKKVKPNKQNRMVLFNIVDQNDDGLISYQEYILFMKYGFTFASLDRDRNGLVDANEIAKTMTTNISPIPMTKTEADKIFSFTNYEIIMRIDFLEYMAFCFTEYKMNPHLVKGTKFLVPKEDLERVLEKVDLKIIKKDLVASLNGVKLPHNNDYNYVSAIKITLQTHARAKITAYRERNEKNNK